MSRLVLEALPELDTLLEALRDAGLADVVWSVVGGVPANYLKLSGLWVEGGGGSAAPVATAFVQAQLIRAIAEVSLAATADTRLKALFSRFRGAATVRHAVLEEEGIVRAPPDTVLRAEIDQAAVQLVLKPADAATALVLRHGLADVPSMDGLKALLSKGGE
jgi:hypothetical protein